MTNNRNRTIKVVIVIVALVITLVTLGPLVTIWSLNTLFGLEIDYTFWTWLAALWLSSILTIKHVSR